MILVVTCLSIRQWPSFGKLWWVVNVGNSHKGARALTFRGKGRSRFIKGPSCHGGGQGPHGASPRLDPKPNGHCPSSQQVRQRADAALPL